MTVIRIYLNNILRKFAIGDLLLISTEMTRESLSMALTGSFELYVAFRREAETMQQRVLDLYTKRSER